MCVRCGSGKAPHRTSSKTGTSSGSLSPLLLRLIFLGGVELTFPAMGASSIITREGFKAQAFFLASVSKK